VQDDALFLEHYDHVRTYCEKFAARTWCPHLSEDLVAEMMLSFLNSSRIYRGTGCFLSFAKQRAKWRAIEFLKRDSRLYDCCAFRYVFPLDGLLKNDTLKLANLIGSKDRNAESVEFIEDLHVLLRGEDSVDARMLKRRYVDGLKAVDVASEFGVTHQMVSIRLLRICKRLRDKLTHSMPIDRK